MAVSYEGLREGTKRFNERNDCTVVALSVAAGIKYDMAHYMLASSGARKPRRGAHHAAYMPIYERVMDLETVDLDKLKKRLKRNVKNLTVNNIVDTLPAKGTFLVWVSGHILAIKDLSVVDWSENRKHRVLKVMRVVRRKIDGRPDSKAVRDYVKHMKARAKKAAETVSNTDISTIKGFVAAKLSRVVFAVNKELTSLKPDFNLDNNDDFAKFVEVVDASLRDMAMRAFKLSANSPLLKYAVADFSTLK